MLGQSAGIFMPASSNTYRCVSVAGALHRVTTRSQCHLVYRCKKKCPMLPGLSARTGSPLAHLGKHHPLSHRDVSTGRQQPFSNRL